MSASQASTTPKTCQSISILETNMKSILNRMDTYSSMISRIECLQSEVDKDHAMMHANFKTLYSILSTTNAERGSVIDDMKDRMATIEHNVSVAAIATHADIRSMAECHKSDVENVKQRIEALVSSVGETDAVSFEIIRRLDSLEAADQTKAVKALATLVKDMKAPKRRVLEMETQIQSLVDAHKDLKNRLVRSESIDSLKKIKSRLRALENTKPSSTNQELEDRVAGLELLVSQLTTQASSAIEELRDKFMSMVSPYPEYVKCVEIVPVYDYAVIKARKAVLHMEFMSTHRFFKRLLDMKYNIPVAIAVVK